MNDSEKPSIAAQAEDEQRPVHPEPQARPAKKHSKTSKKKSALKPHPRAGGRSTSQARRPAVMVRPRTKSARILELLQRPGGASLAELRKATGWQAHSVRGFLSGVLKKKLGVHLSSTYRNGKRTYRVASK